MDDTFTSQTNNEGSTLILPGSKQPALMKQGSTASMTQGQQIPPSANDPSRRKPGQKPLKPVNPPVIDQKVAALCHADTITIITKLLSSLGDYGFKLGPNSLVQEPHQKKDVLFKTHTYFEQDDDFMLEEEENKVDKKPKNETEKEIEALMKR
mmetsp:Transcript_37266/g.35882  ORF Transcript_37266/g.35882 Transcript_37266/m.35882 type:complete len:153 (+) Transcript_37266:1188-1646(+)